MKKLRRNITNFSLILITGLIFTRCMWDDPITAKKITKDYYLTWMYDKSNQDILKTSDNGMSGAVVISETVFAVGFNDRYLIAKQHPNLQEVVSERLFGKRGKNGDFLLTNPSDTIYLWDDDKFYEEDGKWYHISNGWNAPDSLKPYKKITYYHIINISNKNGESYKFDNELEFWAKRENLGIPQSLDFTIIDKDLE